MAEPGPGQAQAAEARAATISRASASGAVAVQPVEIRSNRADRRIEIDFTDGARFAYSYEYLRVESPSAEVQGHGPAQRRFIGGCRLVGLADIEPVGHYAVRLVFDDGHDTGIYSWDYLHELGRDHDQRWQRYLAGLAAAGLSRG